MKKSNSNLAVAKSTITVFDDTKQTVKQATTSTILCTIF